MTHFTSAPLQGRRTGCDEAGDYDDAGEDDDAGDDDDA